MIEEEHKSKSRRRKNGISKPGSTTTVVYARIKLKAKNASHSRAPYYYDDNSRQTFSIFAVVLVLYTAKIGTGSILRTWSPKETYWPHGYGFVVVVVLMSTVHVGTLHARWYRIVLLIQ